ncbi:MAG: class F sortase [Candidatus Nephthysia bennettiae]|uniref:Class F sortase n=1 Tax=Candidatus Nephthysia bennettiae TaxID=3127016 RepID=A0A934KBK1_9BACT|nr:class F sortase [Candidatus Dormibacteraeota bacterium]MBJ7611557.1 class F sortase [Candidatus Dormibacteraeota bacterium]PZS00299.1 MAG: class F sortase [Candidatus Dormibacteraeota bacterium]
MPTLVRTHRAVFALVGVAVAAILAVSGWLMMSAHARPQPRPAHVAAMPSGLPSAAATATPAPSTPPVIQPQQLTIPRLGVQAPIENKGIDSHNQMEAPDKPFDVAWYPFTSRPGSGGNAVFAGHKDFAGVGPAVFWKLGQLGPGDTIQVTGADQTQLQYEVTQTWDYTLSNIPMASVLAQGNGDQLTLITCAGSYSRAAGYDHRLVVRARRIA